MTVFSPLRQSPPIERAGVSPAVTNRKLSAVLAAALGIVIVFAAGFAPNEVVHGAAHDSRHSFAFPCH